MHKIVFIVNIGLFFTAGCGDAQSPVDPPSVEIWSKSDTHNASKSSAPNEHEKVSHAASVKMNLEESLELLKSQPDNEKARGVVIDKLEELIKKDIEEKEWGKAAIAADALREILPQKEPYQRVQPLRQMLSKEVSAVTERLGILLTELKNPLKLWSHDQSKDWNTRAGYEISLFNDISQVAAKFDVPELQKAVDVALRTEVARLSITAKWVGSDDLGTFVELHGWAQDLIHRLRLRNQGSDAPMKEALRSTENVLVELKNTAARRERQKRARYNIKAIGVLSDVNSRYDENTGFLNDKEDQLVKMLIEGLGPISTVYLDPPTMLVYNELLMKTMEQLNVDQKIKVVEGMARANKWPLFERVEP